jgi:hypothetical protein
MSFAGDKRTRDEYAGDTRRHDADAAATLKDVASSFRCSITSSLVMDPVTTCDGQLYERAAIEEWLAEHTTSPNTGKSLRSKVLVPAHSVRDAVERVVYSGCLVPEESREWLMRKALDLLKHGRASDAQPLLERALGEGDAVAGWHLGRLLIERAANAGVPEAAAAVAKLCEATPIQSISHVKVSDTVRLLSTEAMRRAFSDHEDWRQQQIEPTMRLGSLSEAKLAMSGTTVKVVRTDSRDNTIAVSPISVESSFLWFPIAACSL